MYQYKDHLGNVRLSYTDVSTTSTPVLEIIEESNYYPFGLKHKGYNNVTSSNGNSVAQKLKFGGMEYQEELDLNWYDITARNYDPALGRWMNIDPLAEKMRRHSPYNYAFNNPIFFIDPDGMAPQDANNGDQAEGDGCDWLCKLTKIFTGDKQKQIKEKDSSAQVDPEEKEENQAELLKETNEKINDATSVTAGATVTAKNNVAGDSHTFGYAGEWTLLGGFKVTQDGFVSTKLPLIGNGSLILNEGGVDFGVSKNTPLAGGSLTLGIDGDGDYKIDATGRVTIFEAKSKTTINSSGDVTSQTTSIGVGARDVTTIGSFTFTSKIGAHLNVKTKKKK